MGAQVFLGGRGEGVEIFDTCGNICYLEDKVRDLSENIFYFGRNIRYLKGNICYLRRNICHPSGNLDQVLEREQDLSLLKKREMILGVNKFIFIFLSNIREGGENGRKRFLIDTIWGKGLINFL